MPLTRSFHDTVRIRAARDANFRVELLAEAVNAFLGGENELGKLLLLRDYVNATIGFGALGRDLGKSPKSLMRMLSAAGNPRADSLVAIIARLQQAEGVS